MSTFARRVPIPAEIPPATYRIVIGSDREPSLTIPVLLRV